MAAGSEPPARDYEQPEPAPPAPPRPPLRARQVCEAMDLEIAPNNVDNTRLKLKRLAERGILVETEQGLSGQNIVLSLAEVAGTSCTASQCSMILSSPFFCFLTRKMSTTD